MDRYEGVVGLKEDLEGILDRHDEHVGVQRVSYWQITVIIVSFYTRFVYF